MQYGIKQYIFVIRELTAREIKRKYSRSVLGIVWSVLQPFLYMCVMTMVFSGFTLNISSYPSTLSAPLSRGETEINQIPPSLSSFLIVLNVELNAVTAVRTLQHSHKP